MKKFLAAPLLLFAFLFFPLVSFAQTQNGNLLFDPASNASITNLTQNPSPVTISLPPFTSIVVQPNSFDQNVTIKVHAGFWDNIKALLPAGQTPIAFYSIDILDENGQPVIPLKPLEVKAYNNYINSVTYFYPINQSDLIDEKNTQNIPGPVYLSTNLPVNDIGFIVAVNKVIDKNDASLNPLKNPITPAPLYNFTGLSNLNSMEKLATLVVLIFCGLIIVYSMTAKKKHRKK